MQAVDTLHDDIFILQVSGASRLRLRLGVRVALVMHICTFSPRGSAAVTQACGRVFSWLGDHDAGVTFFSFERGYAKGYHNTFLFVHNSHISSVREFNNYN
jgi:hypothetical protein